MIRKLMIICLILIFAKDAFPMVCTEGFILETNVKGEQNCRNQICDAGINLYGESIDMKGASLPQPQDFYGNYDNAKDFHGMPRPKVKGPDGKWVGWSIGAVQCPPDPIGLHPNPDWPCGFDYCKDEMGKLTAPLNFRLK